MGHVCRCGRWVEGDVLTLYDSMIEVGAPAICHLYHDLTDSSKIWNKLVGTVWRKMSSFRER